MPPVAEEDPARTDPLLLPELLRTLEELLLLELLRTEELELPELLTLELELLPLERETELPLERETELLERLVELLERLAELLLPVERLVFCWLERTAEEELRLLLEELLPEDRTVEELLPEEREVELPEVERVEEPPLVERVWATISGAVSMDSAKTREAAIVINLLIASQILKLTV